MATPEQTIDQLVASVNDVAQTARTLFFGLLLAALTIAAIVVGTTDEAVLRNAVEAAPTLGVRISVSLAHLFAPIILLFLHTNALIQLDLLGIRWMVLNKAITSAGLSRAERQHVYARIHSFAAVLYLAKTQRKLTRRLLRYIAWLTVIGIPVAALLALQIGFLRYQSEWITHTQQLIVCFETLVLGWFLCRRQYRQPGSKSGICQKWSWRVALQSTKWAAVAIVPILALYVLQWWFPKDLKDGLLNHLQLAIVLGAAAMLIKFLCQPQNRTWSLLIVPAISLGLANTPSGQEAKDIRWRESLAYSHWRQEDTMPRQDNDSFPEGFCSFSVPEGVEPKDAKSSWDKALLWPMTKLCNPMDIYVCPSLGWGCRYLRLATEIEISNAVPLSVLKDAGIMAPDEYQIMQVRAAGLHLRNRNLRYADFKDASLFGADFIGADLRWVNLEEANLQSVWLDSADLSHAVLDDARIQYASFDSAILDDATLREAQLQKTTFVGARLIGAVLNRARLKNADFSDANLTNVNARAADLAGASLEGADLTDADFTGANLTGANLSGAKFKPEQFDNATWLYAQMAGVQIDGVPPLATPSQQELEANAQIVAAGFKDLACTDGNAGEGIISWVGDSFDPADVTQEARKSWGWVSAKAIFKAFAKAIEDDLPARRARARLSCPKLDESDLQILQRELGYLETPPQM